MRKVNYCLNRVNTHGIATLLIKNYFKGDNTITMFNKQSDSEYFKLAEVLTTFASRVVTFDKSLYHVTLKLTFYTSYPEP